MFVLRSCQAGDYLITIKMQRPGRSRSLLLDEQALGTTEHNYASCRVMSSCRAKTCRCAFLSLDLLTMQSRFGDNWLQITWNSGGFSPKRDWSSKRVNTSTCACRRDSQYTSKPRQATPHAWCTAAVDPPGGRPPPPGFCPAERLPLLF